MAVETGAAVSFVPADPPRSGRVVVYQTDRVSPMPDSIGQPGAAKVVTGPSGRVRKARAVRCRPDAALAYLLTAEAASPSHRVWSLAARKALELTARGLIVPGLDSEGHAAWRIAGLTGDDDAWLRQLAEAMPVAAFGVVDKAGRLPDPYRLLRAFLDAVADSIARSPEARQATGEHLFAVDDDSDGSMFGRAAQRLAHDRDHGFGLALILDADGYYPSLRGSWFDRREPARLVSDDETGDKTPDLRRSLAEVGRRISWPALSETQQRYWGPVEIYLAADDLEFLFDRGGIAALGSHGVEVRSPVPVTREFKGSLVLTDGTETVDPKEAFTLEHVPAFTWRASVDGRELSEDELDRIRESSGPLVQLDDRILLLDATRRRQLRARLDQTTPLQAIAAALTGTVDIADQDVPVIVAGPLVALRDRLRDVGEARAVQQPAVLTGLLRDYQLRGLAWLTALTELGFGAVLADDMGLGKTITLIAFHLSRHERGGSAGPTLVVCPSTLLATWEAELRRFAPSVAVRRFHGPRRSLDAVRPGEIVLTTYGTLRRDAARLTELPWDLVCADEAQHVKNPASSTAKALRSIRSASRVALTGTPVENNLTDLWAILDWATPGLFGSLKGFRSTYGRSAERGDAATAAKLGALVRPFMLRRLKSEVAAELPPKTVTDQYAGLSSEQASLYQRVVEEGMDGVRGADGIERRGRVLAMLTRLKQVCNHPAQYHRNSDPTSGESGKLRLLDELLDTIIAENEQTLVFTQYAAMGRLLRDHLGRRGIRAAFLHGQTSVRGRERLVAEFQDGKHEVLVLSLKTAGTGLTLTSATHVVHYDRWWNPAVEDQASDRAHRIGQTRPVQIHRLICEGTLEERIAQMLEQKRALAESVIGTGEAALTELRDEQLLELIHLERR